jgi:hypothetical protein
LREICILPTSRLKVRPSVAGRLVNLLKEEAEEVVVGRIIEISPDPGDDCLCGFPEVGRADFLVTLNPRDFPQDKLSAKAVSAVEFFKNATSQRWTVVGIAFMYQKTVRRQSVLSPLSDCRNSERNPRRFDS